MIPHIRGHRQNFSEFECCRPIQNQPQNKLLNRLQRNRLNIHILNKNRLNLHHLQRFLTRAYPERMGQEQNNPTWKNEPLA